MAKLKQPEPPPPKPPVIDWIEVRGSPEAGVGGPKHLPTVQLGVSYAGRERGLQPFVRVFLKGSAEGTGPGARSQAEAQPLAVALARRLIAENIAALQEADAVLAAAEREAAMPAPTPEPVTGSAVRAPRGRTARRRS